MTPGALIPVFVGPSWPALRDAPPAGIAPRPPARCGDVVAAVEAGAAALGLIDGIFETGPSVWHKELLYALECGVTVVGGASLGALRAAELAPFGMVGVGRAFDGYHRGALLRDDAVMVLHAPAEFGWRPLTIGLPDMLDTIEAVEGLAPDQRARLRAIAWRLPFRRRDWPTLCAGEEDGNALAARLAAAHVPTKQRDAEAVVAALLAGACPAVDHTATVPRTSHFRRLLAGLSAPG